LIFEDIVAVLKKQREYDNISKFLNFRDLREVTIMLKIPIGKDENGNEVYVATIGLDRRENAITNKKLAINQQAAIDKARNELRKLRETYPNVIIY
jgi:hypothetical protein